MDAPTVNANGLTLPVPAEAQSALSTSPNEEGHPWWWHLGWVLPDVRAMRLRRMAEQESLSDDQRVAQGVIQMLERLQRERAGGAQPAAAATQATGVVPQVNVTPTFDVLGNQIAVNPAATTPGPTAGTYTTPEMAQANQRLQDVLARLTSGNRPPGAAPAGNGNDIVASYEPAAAGETRQQGMATSGAPTAPPLAAPVAARPAPFAPSPVGGLGAGLGPGVSISLPLGRHGRINIAGGGGLTVSERQDAAFSAAYQPEYDRILQEKLTSGAPMGKATVDAYREALVNTAINHPETIPYQYQRQLDVILGIPGERALQQRQSMLDIPVTPDQAATALAKAEGLEPGTPAFQKRFNTLRGESAEAVSGARATGTAKAPRKMSDAEARDADQVLQAAGIIEQLGTSYQRARGAIGPIAGVTKRLADLAGTNPQAYAEFQAANASLTNLIVYMRSGKQINENEAKRLLQEIPQFGRESFTTWEAKLRNAVRLVYRGLKNRYTIGKQRNTLGIDEVYGKPLGRLEAMFPDAVGAAGTRRLTGTLPSSAIPTEAPTSVAPAPPDTKSLQDLVDRVLQ